jgi:hypothetical protein
MANQTWKNIIVRNWNGSGFTIMDRNLWAVNAYTWNENSSVQWNYYQWWNNYWFSSSETLSDTSTGQVSTLDNWPWNYYFSSTFIYGNNNWSSNQNNNLWWWEWDTLTSNWTWTNINRQWPCADWYHVPSTLEWHWLFQAWCKYRWWTNCVVSDWNSLSWSSLWWNATFTNFQSDLKLPFAGYRNWEAGSVYSQGTEGLYWSSSSSASVYYLHFNSSEIYPQYGNYHAYGMSARCFRN